MCIIPVIIYFMSFTAMNQLILLQYCFMRWVHGALHPAFMMCCGIHVFLLQRASYSAMFRCAFGMINFFANGVVSDSNDVLLTGVPPVPKGEKMHGQFFPLLTDTVFNGVRV